jgi:hypothetical protein
VPDVLIQRIHIPFNSCHATNLSARAAKTAHQGLGTRQLASAAKHKFTTRDGPAGDPGALPGQAGAAASVPDLSPGLHPEVRQTRLRLGSNPARREATRHSTAERRARKRHVGPPRDPCSSRPPSMPIDEAQTSLAVVVAVAAVAAEAVEAAVAAAAW